MFLSNCVISNEINKEYQHKKKEVFLYRMIFIGLGVLLLSIANLLLFKSHFPRLPIFVESFLAIKTLCMTTAYLFGFAATWIGCSLRTDKELLREMYKDASKRIAKLAPIGKKRELKAELNDLTYHRARALQENLEAREKFAILTATKLSYAKLLEELREHS